MTTGTRALGRDRWFVFQTDWAGYRALDRARNERSVPRLIYLDGRVTLVSPGFPHEKLSSRLDWLVSAVLVGFGIPAICAGHTTYRRKSRRAGLEGDETYYIANAARLAGKTDIDLRVDPPPDLVVEVVSHPVKDALEVCRRFGVPEVWVCDGRALRILLLRPDRRYARSPVSASLPMLSAEAVLGWVQRPETGDETAWRRDVRRWVEDELVPSHRQAQGR
jgi:Uma2 family endonuclease